MEFDDGVGRIRLGPAGGEVCSGVRITIHAFPDSLRSLQLHLQDAQQVKVVEEDVEELAGRGLAMGRNAFGGNGAHKGYSTRAVSKLGVLGEDVGRQDLRIVAGTRSNLGFNPVAGKAIHPATELRREGWLLA